MPRPTPQSITEKRKKDAARQARYRAKKKAGGIPQTHEMERVMLEAYSHAFHERTLAVDYDNIPQEVRDFWKDVGNFALKLLTTRHGYRLEKAKDAWGRAIRMRPGNHPPA